MGLKDDVAYLHLLGQIQHESVDFKYMEEIASGKAYEGRKDLGNIRPGDGKRYKGRGPIQVTGRANYTKIYKEFFVPNGLGEYNIVKNPELGSDPRIGSLMSIGWLLVTDSGRRAIAAINNHDIRSATKNINGSYNGLQDRINRINKLLEQYKSKKRKHSKGGIISNTSFEPKDYILVEQIVSKFETVNPDEKIVQLEFLA